MKSKTKKRKTKKKVQFRQEIAAIYNKQSLIRIRHANPFYIFV